MKVVNINSKVARSKPELLLIRGLPGSGKSTLASKHRNHHHIEADMYFERNGIYQFDASKLSAAHRWCQRQTREHLLQGHSVVVANTFVRHKDMEPYLKMAKELDVNYRTFKAEGNWSSIHNVPMATILRMCRDWQE